MSTNTLRTVDEFARMRTLDTEAYELVEGELVPLSSPTPEHNRIKRRLERKLEDYFELHPIGEPMSETDCRIIDNVRRPDVMVFLSDRAAQIDEYRVPVPVAPDIAIEVVSPNESAVDIRRKEKEYLAGGCQEIWIVDHSNDEIWIYTTTGARLIPGDATLETPLLSSFAASVAELLR